MSPWERERESIPDKVLHKLSESIRRGERKKRKKNLVQKERKRSKLMFRECARMNKSQRNEATETR